MSEHEEGDILSGSNLGGGAQAIDPLTVFNESGRLVTARGTEEGLILRLDGKAEWSDIVDELRRFLESRKRFLDGAQVAIEWLERLPTTEQSEELSSILRNEFAITIVSRKRKPEVRPRERSEEKITEEKKRGVTVPLFGVTTEVETGEVSFADPLLDSLSDEAEGGEGFFEGVRKSSSSKLNKVRAEVRGSERREDEEAGFLSGARGKASYWDRMSKFLGEELAFDEDANAKIVFGTLRSGQRVETPFSLIVVGDVNPGADLIAGGDIIVLGNLRGTAHAAAYDDDGQERVIVALQMQPMQLRIGSVISRGSDEGGQGTEVARIDSRRIIVEAFNPRGSFLRKGR